MKACYKCFAFIFCCKFYQLLLLKIILVCILPFDFVCIFGVICDIFCAFIFIVYLVPSFLGIFLSLGNLLLLLRNCSGQRRQKVRDGTSPEVNSWMSVRWLRPQFNFSFFFKISVVFISFGFLMTVTSSVQLWHLLHLCRILLPFLPHDAT